MLVGVVAWGFGIASVLSFNVWSGVRIFGHFPPFIAITDLVTNVILPVGGIFYAIFAGWMMLKTETADELKMTAGLYRLWRWLVRFVAPIGILVILVKGLW